MPELGRGCPSLLAEARLSLGLFVRLIQHQMGLKHPKTQISHLSLINSQFVPRVPCQVSTQSMPCTAAYWID
jgi:hypothetical protein